MLVSRWDRLAGDEQLWLESYWPDLFDESGRPCGGDDVGPPLRTGEYMEDELRSPYTDEQKAEFAAAGAALHAEHIADAYERTRRRMAKATSGG